MPGVLACSSHVEKGDVVAVSVAIEQQKLDGEWCVGLTRGTVLQGLESGTIMIFIFIRRHLILLVTNVSNFLLYEIQIY